MGVAVHAESTQNIKSAISCSISRNREGIKKDKHQSFLEADVNVFIDDSQAYPTYPK